MNRAPDYVEFFRARYIEEVLEFRKFYPTIKTLIIEYSTLKNFDNLAGELLLTHPDSTIYSLKEKLGKLDLSEMDPELPDDNMSKAEIAIRGLPDTIPIYKIGQEQAQFHFLVIIK